MKRILSVILILILALSAVSCGVADDGDSIKIVCTTFPQYDWVRNIVGDDPDISLTLLLDSGVDLHSYQPTAADMVKVSSAGLFVYVGGESDAWTEDAISGAKNESLVAFSLFSALSEQLREEDEMGTGEEESDHDHGDEEETEYDEHVWLSLKNAVICCRALCETLCTLNPDSAETYRANTETYCGELTELDGEFTDAVNEAPNRALVFCDRFPFKYFAEDYGLECYAAFAGCSAETEASFSTIIYLADKLDELELSHIAVIDGSRVNIYDTVIAQTSAKNQTTVSFDSMQSVTAARVAAGATYINIMEGNLAALRTALSD